MLEVFLKFYVTGVIDGGDLVETLSCLFYSMELEEGKIIQHPLLVGAEAWAVPPDFTKWHGVPNTPLFFDQEHKETNDTVSRLIYVTGKKVKIV